MTPLSVVLLSLALLPVLYRYILTRKQRLSRLPPGPRSLPLFGNMFNLPKTRPWVTYRDWSSAHGSDLVFLDLPNRPTVIINTHAAVTELMERRSKNYSDKPVMVMDQLMGWDFSMGFMPQGHRWRESRKTFHQFFNQLEVRTYHGVEQREVRAFLKRATRFTECIDALSVSMTYAAIILDLVYGMRIQDMRDRYVLLSQEAVKGISESRLPGQFWIEYFPILRYLPTWMPGSSARRVAEKYRPATLASRNEPYEKVEHAVLEGTATPSIAQKLIQEFQEKGSDTTSRAFRDQILRDVTGTCYTAATDTQTATTLTFFHAMAESPSAQRKAQKELTAVVGPSRLPTIDDIGSLPYVQAVLLEVMRWSPITPLGLPHRAIEDDEYKGQHIPAGAVIYGNVWAALRDPLVYPDHPENFNPDRFLLSGKLNPDVPRPDAFFGFGRRICAGRWLAEDTMSLMFASILHVFTIEPLVEDTVAKQFSTGLVSTPESLPYCLKLRNAAALATIDLEDGR